ncbi:FixH family protein [Alkalihalobacterium chitinilyticum]|uniref:FixH family protein n=1 Tax=Alkalihalobacterium chitinilyticum TaxID=2980103 RepID=A0ABT5VAM0_9BACI|nr:FixH family protein [Alkalihalobacterium chitinilyticum]MDE5412494.1 FixH family protein [Alkalihalobacterium chitinilyticum]
MKKKLSIIGSVLLLGLMTACGQTGDDGQANVASGPCENPLVPIEVDFTWDPETIVSDESIQFTAHVTHDGFNVEQADDVQFEIWEHANPDYHHMLETENQGDGLYTLDWTFPEEGVYYAYYHVTACAMHRMEKQMVVVGDVDVEAITAQPDTVTTKMEGHGEHGGHDEQDEHQDHEDHEGDDEHEHDHHNNDEEEDEHNH